jgi:peptide/nickel transport system permease protein
MLQYILRRVFLMVPTVIGIVLMTFVLIRLAPGEPAAVSVEGAQGVSAADIRKFRQQWDLDRPIHVQAWNWVGKLARLDFGLSSKDNRPAMAKILERLPATLSLQIVSLGLIFLIGVPLGVFSAAHQHRLGDRLSTLGTFLFFSFPSFFLAILLQLVFGVWLRWLPVDGASALGAERWGWGPWMWDRAQHMVLPVTVYALVGMAVIARYTRGSMLEVMRQDYIRTARAKGAPEGRVRYRHGLRNALIPIITLMGAYLPSLIGGSFIVETIFSWPGMGRLTFDAIMQRDYNVIMAQAFVVCLLTLMGNLLADLGYAWADPRIAYR